MPLFDRLTKDTESDRQEFMRAPIIERALNKDIDIDDYIAFLTQAYHHVSHTVPLLMLVGSKLKKDQEWIRLAVADYIEEELGHQEWILNDIEECGFDKESARQSQPSFDTELMVSYAYDQIERVNPLGFFGMVHVLEGTSINLADTIAQKIGEKLGLSAKAFTYLISHGSLDQKHTDFFKELINQIEPEHDQEVIIKSAKMFYRLYGNIFRNLDKNHCISRLAV